MVAKIAPCGLDCGNCAAYKATKSNDPERLREVAEEWSSEERKLSPQDMICDGCFSERTFGFCDECKVRACVVEKGFELCSECGEYPCDKLEGYWTSFSTPVETLRANLEKTKPHS